jgi:tripartite-type tricarboxylate transporter receptor subunit TctC
LKCFLFTCLAAISLAAHAQNFPSTKPITLVVPFAAGGPTDRVARDLAEAMRAPFGIAVFLVDKAAGAAGKTALKEPDFIKKQEGLGAVVITEKRVDPAEHKKFVAVEIAKWSPIIKAAGVYAD